MVQLLFDHGTSLHNLTKSDEAMSAALNASDCETMEPLNFPLLESLIPCAEGADPYSLG